MPTEAKPTLEEILAEALEFHRTFDSLLLATVDGDGNPNASYAVHTLDAQGRCFHIYISELAAHTRNLHRHPRASVLFIEDESRAQHLFARKRLTCEYRAEALARGSDPWRDIMDGFVAKHGKFMEMLRELEDFHLFRLTPEKATYVRGFAQAYELDGEQLGAIRHVNDKGHRPANAATSEAMDNVA